MLKIKVEHIAQSSIEAGTVVNVYQTVEEIENCPSLDDKQKESGIEYLLEGLPDGELGMVISNEEQMVFVYKLEVKERYNEDRYEILED